jgi:hypothetical protein
VTDERVAVSLFYWSLRRLLELVVLRFRSEREKEIEATSDWSGTRASDEQAKRARV